MAIYFTNYASSKSIKMLSFHFCELKIEEHEKKYLMVDEYMLYKILDKIKK